MTPHELDRRLTDFLTAHSRVSPTVAPLERAAVVLELARAALSVPEGRPRWLECSATALGTFGHGHAFWFSAIAGLIDDWLEVVYRFEGSRVSGSVTWAPRRARGGRETRTFEVDAERFRAAWHGLLVQLDAWITTLEERHRKERES